MSDKNNIPEATNNLSLDTDGDGVVEIHEGETKNIEKFKKIKVESFTGKEKIEIAVPKDSFLERSFQFAVTTIAGENWLGKGGAVVKDALSQLGLLPPVLNKGSDLIGNTLKRKQTKVPMIDIIKRAFTKSNGGFWRLWDEMKGRDLKYYAALALRAALIVGIYYVADYFGLPVDQIIPAIFGE